MPVSLRNSAFSLRLQANRRSSRLGRAPLAAAALAVAVLSACGGSSADTPAGAPIVQTLATDSGRISLTVETVPNPPIRGNNRVIYTIADASGQPQDGLTFNVVPWMPAHGHGTSVIPQIEPKGQGVYSIKNVVLYMPGQWELRTSFTATGDHAAPAFQIR